MTRRRLSFAALLLAVVLILGEIAVVTAAHLRTGTPIAPYSGEPIASGKSAPAFVLESDRGQRFAYAPKAGDPPTAFYFGFTRCFDACPLALARLARAHRAMARLRVYFVTIDPLHDTPAVIHRYLLPFDRAFVGLTGSEKNVLALAAAFGVTAMSRTAQPVHDDAVVLVDGQGIQRLRYTGATLDIDGFANDVNRLARK